MNGMNERNVLVIAIARRARTVLVLLAGALAFGTLGYGLIGRGAFRWFDCFYMTVITVTTIGYGEILDFSAHPAGRWFTVAVAFFGVGMATYVISSITALAADPRLREAWRARKMEKAIDRLSGHYLICGWGSAAPHIAAELTATGRACVGVAAGVAGPTLPDGTPLPFHIEGDPTEDAILERAGIRRAAGVFAAAPEDPINIVITVAARRLNPALRIIACAADPAHAPKMRVAGADATVSPTAIGGLRMASEMVRPAVVSFLDTMLREPARNLRVEELVAGAAVDGRALGELRLNRPGEALLVAVRRGADWRFHPPDTHCVSAGDVLVFMATPESRAALADRCGGTEAGS